MATASGAAAACAATKSATLCVDEIVWRTGAGELSSSDFGADAGYASQVQLRVIRADM